MPLKSPHLAPQRVGTSNNRRSFIGSLNEATISGRFWFLGGTFFAMFSTGMQVRFKEISEITWNFSLK